MIETSQYIVKSISKNYFSYKEISQFIKELIVYKKYVFENNKQENKGCNISSLNSNGNNQNNLSEKED